MTEHSSLNRMLTLVLALAHLCSGFLILLVASWFIAACSIAGVGFNYMLPAVIIRAMALIRIASGYFYMLVGHHDLLQRIASLRLKIFAGLHNKVTLSREQSLDALHHQSEEVAAFWIAWVSQNAGAFLCLLILNVACFVLSPQIILPLALFSGIFIAIYAGLLLSLVFDSAALAKAKKTIQMQVVEHIESASLWHLYANNAKPSPSLSSLRNLENKIQNKIRFATLAMLLVAIASITVIFSSYSAQLSGNVLFIVVPMALLAVNDWLSPTFANQTKLLQVNEAKRAIESLDKNSTALSSQRGKIDQFVLRNVTPQHSNMSGVNATFNLHQLTVLQGSSGTGKSRLLQAINGLAAFSGHKKMRIEGANLQCSPTTLLTDCLYVEQFPYVMSDTLRANLIVANEHASDTRLIEVLAKVGLDYLDDLNLWLGDHGRPLSGGEKKRLGLARAMLSDSTILLLDEPFESLDQSNMQKITHVINDLRQNKIVVIATHILPEELCYQQVIELEQQRSINSNATSGLN